LACRKKTSSSADRNGVVYKGRNEGMDPQKEKFAADTNAPHAERSHRRAPIFSSACPAPVFSTRIMVKNGGCAAHSGAGQPDAGNHAG
jgi:malate dehydrogenase (oxaloacetate-decarboxylating)(NADP+)